MATDATAAFCRALWRHESKTIAALAPRVDPNAKDRWGNTPLLMAAQYGDLPLVSLLLDRGAEVDQGRQHLTPITLAARRGAADIVGFLRTQGAAMSIATWVHLGEEGRVEKTLKREPALAHLRDEAGIPLLHHAVSATGAAGTAGTAALMAPLTRLLLEYGADPDACDHRGVPVRDSARTPEIRALLDGPRRGKRIAKGRNRTTDSPTPGAAKKRRPSMQ